jgi:hypothetical protein
VAASLKLLASAAVTVCAGYVYGGVELWMTPMSATGEYQSAVLGSRS